MENPNARPIILVLGATGYQGGSVARYLLADGTFSVRCMVRSLSDKTQSLFNQGAEIVKGDLNDVKSLERAMEGAYGVFAVTNFWECGYAGEIQQGKNICEALRRNPGVKHLVWSTLDRNSEVPHFESKVIIEDEMRSLPIQYQSYLVTSFYFENFLALMRPIVEKNDEGSQYIFCSSQLPSTRVPMFSVLDTGGFVLAAFKNPEKYGDKKDLPAVSDYITYPEIVEIFGAVTGHPTKFKYILPSDLTFEVGSPEIVANLHFFDCLQDETKIDRRGSLLESNEIFDQTMDFEDWLRCNVEAFELS
jgi:uncharacterized protein YbjT (DUF2867 family)